MRLASFFSVFLIAASMFLQGDFAYAGDRPEKTYDYKDFSKIKVSGVYELSVRHSDTYTVKLSGRQAALERASIRVSNDTLYLGHEKRKNFRGKKTLTAYITLPTLRGIDVSGVVDGTVTGIDVDDFSVEVSGVGDLKLAGRCHTLMAELSGVGDLNAKALMCQIADVQVSGVGDASVYASEALKAHVSGIGDLTCYGSPKQVRKNRNFFSSIRVH